MLMSFMNRDLEFQSVHGYLCAAFHSAGKFLKKHQAICLSRKAEGNGPMKP
jgi:hypothetical protein